jgi:hypothetical protein
LQQTTDSRCNEQQTAVASDIRFAALVYYCAAQDFAIPLAGFVRSASFQ